MTWTCGEGQACRTQDCQSLTGPESESEVTSRSSNVVDGSCAGDLVRRCIGVASTILELSEPMEVWPIAIRSQLPYLAWGNEREWV